MEDDDKIQSPHSPASESPGSPRANGLITVTVAAPTPPQNSLTLELPVQQQRPKGNGGGGGGREDWWSDVATAVLIDAWGERYLQLSRGKLTQKHWMEVADIVSSSELKTNIQCKQRMDTVKKKYKMEKWKIAAGGGPSKWLFYERLHQLLSPTGSTGGGAAGASTANNLSTQKVFLGIPVGIWAGNQNPYQAHQCLQKHQPQMKTLSQMIQLQKRAPVNSDSSPSDRESSPISSDSFPPGTFWRKRPRVPRVINSDAVETKDKGWEIAVKGLTQAILKFGEAYEQAESFKIQQVVEMEKQRMKFAREVELQRMQFFMKTQWEISKLKHGRRGGGNASNHHSNINNHSDSDDLISLDSTVIWYAHN